MADGKVQVPPDSTGKNIDTSEITRTDSVTLVERQRIIIGDANNPTSLMTVNPDGTVTMQMDFESVLVQLKRIALLLEIFTGQTVSDEDVS